MFEKKEIVRLEDELLKAIQFSNIQELDNLLHDNLFFIAPN